VDSSSSSSSSSGSSSSQQPRSNISNKQQQQQQHWFGQRIKAPDLLGVHDECDATRLPDVPP
jgi:hypothetical protein